VYLSKDPFNIMAMNQPHVVPISLHWLIPSFVVDRGYRQFTVNRQANFAIMRKAKGLLIVPSQKEK
jgi:predicted DCC family thiol-disulfide oxidoreductase YuxK